MTFYQSEVFMTKPTTVSHPRVVYRTYTRIQKFEKQPGSNSTLYGSTPYSWTDTRTGSNLPGWRARVARNQDATTTFTGSKQKITKRYGMYSISYRTNVDGDVSKQFYGDIAYCDAPAIVGISTTEADNKAKAKFVKKAIEAQQSFNGAGFAAELGETLHMIGRPMTAIKNFSRSFCDTMNIGINRMGNTFSKNLTRKQRIARLGDFLSQAWLTKSFGIDPFLQDMDDAVKTLAQSQIEHRKSVETLRSRSKTETFSKTGVSTHPGSPSLIYSRWTTATTLTAEVVYRGAIVRRFRSDRLPDYNEIFGLRARDIVPGIWQGIPWSWLVDYVTNVDDILTAYSFNRADLAWCNKTVRKHGVTKCLPILDVQESKRQVQLLGGGYWYGSSTSASSFQQEKWDVVRQSYTGSFVPTFEFDIMNAATIRRLTNLSAVAWSRRNLLTTIRNVLRR